MEKIQKQFEATRSDESLDALFGVLANRRRRYALRCLSNRAVPIGLADLAEDVAALEKETERTNLSASDVQNVHTALYHSDVPKLAEAGLVDYRRDRGTVALTSDATQPV